MKIKKSLVLGLTGFIALSLVGCKAEVKEETPKEVKKSAKTEPAKVELVTETTGDKQEDVKPEVSVEDKLKEAVKENALAMEREDLEDYMDDLIIPEEQVEPTKEALTQMYDMFDLTYTITDIKVLETTPTTAKLEVTQLTKETSGAEGFADNKSVAVHYLKLVDSDWKFEKTELKSSEYLQ